MKSNGSVVAWGNNWYGQCNVPDPNSGFAAIAAGWGHSLGLKTDGSIVAWGNNESGQISNTPTGNDFTAISAGGFHNLALRSDGSIVAWGFNSSGEGIALSGNYFTAISAGLWHNLAIAIYECPAGLTGDLTGDCRVDFEDFAIFANQWLQCGDPFDPNCVP